MMKIVDVQKKSGFLSTRRSKTLFYILINTVFMVSVFLYGASIQESDLTLNFQQKNLAPSLAHIFGTDHVGRDMFMRTMKGLSLSIRIAVIATIAALLVALCFTIILSVTKEKGDAIVSFIIDVFLSIPHMVFLIIISVAVGRGIKGVILGIAATHWTFLTRIIRAEIKQIKQEEYITISKHLGKSSLWITIHHVLPHILPQVLVSTILLFPHAILHEAGISFLGFGLSLSTPAIGIILAESMQYLVQGCWWLAFFPGVMLVLVVRSVSCIGENLKLLVDPYTYHE